VPVITSSGLEEAVLQGQRAIGWQRRDDPAWRQPADRPHVRRGLGFAMAMHGTAIPGLDMGGASLKINDDGSFNLLVGATDLGTGSDTVLAQIAAEVVGVGTEDILVYSSDTDLTPLTPAPMPRARPTSPGPPSSGPPSRSAARSSNARRSCSAWMAARSTFTTGRPGRPMAGR
jgi:CO/xanthine dehydrogenase Mo-binding subunit